MIESSNEPPILERVEEPVTDYVIPVQEHLNPNEGEATAQPSYSHHESHQEDDISEPLPGGPTDTSILKSFKNHVAFAIWAGEERGILKCRNHGLKIPEWPLNNQPRVRDIVMSSSLSPLLECTYRNINHALVSAFTERWQPETNTFHLPFGELSITLYDVAAILKIPVTGRSLGIAIRREVKSIAGYLTLLEGAA
ncbi:protein MAIN-LIKE 1-like [Diospyros lotus]|uniref:protein MAIN-LIKE 1-like n=1 Tax=Diospyros lotus TaxID=55363 RepID=UPI0022511906|nr:protein MAIN-LIKE 1-like [Diospyros lotus]